MVELASNLALIRCCGSTNDAISRGALSNSRTSGPPYIKAHPAVRTAVGRPVVPTRRCKATGAVSKHPPDVSSTLRTWKSPGERCPSHQAHGPHAYRQTTRVRLERQQRGESETEKGDRNQGRVRPEHAPSKAASDRFSHVFSRSVSFMRPILLRSSQERRDSPTPLPGQVRRTERKHFLTGTCRRNR